MTRIPTQLNAFGYDPWGFNADVMRRALLLSALLYRYYFRVQTHGIDHVPAGRVLLIANHAGHFGFSVQMSVLFTYADQQRAAQFRQLYFDIDVDTGAEVDTVQLLGGDFFESGLEFG